MTNDEQVSSGVQHAVTTTHKPVYTGEILLSCRPKTYRKVLDLLGHGRSDASIAHECKVSRMTIRAIRLRQAVSISQRKEELSMLVSDIAVIGSARVADKIGKASVRDAIIGTGVAIDKFLNLNNMGQNQINVAIVMPTEKEREERDARFARLEAMTKRLALPDAAT